MPNRFRVAFVGFSAFERNALASTFRLSVHREPAYVQAPTLADGQFIVADADHSGAVEEVTAAGRVGHTVFIGSLAPAGAAAWMMRPIDPSHVLRELDMLVARQGLASSAAIGPYALPAAAGLGRARAGAAPGPGRRASDSSFGTDAVAPAYEERAARAGSRRRPAEPETREALLVDDSDIALRLLELKLQQLGLRTRSALNSQQALRELSIRQPDFVFLDVDLGPGSELDGLALCRHLRRQPTLAGHSTPVLVMVSADHSEADRVRGTLAGCDGYLAKPLEDRALRRVLRMHGVALPEVAGAPAA